MKLVELLAKELTEWPESAVCITQDSGGVPYGWKQSGAKYRDFGWYSTDDENFGMHKIEIEDIDEASDHKKAIVTREMWQAERDRQKGGEWKRHRGGKRPVDPSVRVECRMRNGDVEESSAGGFMWDHNGAEDDVMKYRVISQPQAKEVEVNIPAGAKLEFAGGVDGVDLKDLDWTVIGTTSSDFSVGKWHQIDGPLKWRDTIIHCQAIIEDCEREIQRNVDLLDAEGLYMQLNAKVGMAYASPSPVHFDGWRAGDLVVCTNEYHGQFTKGKKYIVDRTYVSLGEERIGVEEDDKGRSNGWAAKNFEFHSRT